MGMEKKLRLLTNHPCQRFLGLQIKYFRSKHRLTQVDLSEVSGVKLRHLQKIEAGGVDIKLSTLGALSRGLGITPDTLLCPVSDNFKLMCPECIEHKELLCAGYNQRFDTNL